MKAKFRIHKHKYTGIWLVITPTGRVHGYYNFDIANNRFQIMLKNQWWGGFPNGN